MKVFLSAAVTFGARNPEKIKQIFGAMEKLGVTITDPFIIDQNQVGNLSAKELVDKCVECLRESDCAVAEVSSPSLGVGWEMCYMSQVESKPVLCLVEENRKTSIVITDNPSPNVKTKFYNNENLSLTLKEFFSIVKPLDKKS